MLSTSLGVSPKAKVPGRHYFNKRLLYNKDKGYDNIDFSKITRAKISSQYMEGKCKPRMF